MPQILLVYSVFLNPNTTPMHHLQDVDDACVLVCQGCTHKVPPTEGLKQQKRVVFQFWRLEIRNQDAHGLTLSVDHKGEVVPSRTAGFWGCWQSLVLLSSQAHHSALCLYVQVVLLLCAHGSKFLLFIRTPITPLVRVSPCTTMTSR